MDTSVQQMLWDGTGGKRQVIVRAKAGFETWLRQQLVASRREIKSNHPSIGGLTVELSPRDILALARDAAVETISADAEVRPSGRPVFTWQTADSVNTVLGTLGLAPNPRGGAGVTVALIDSGLEESAAFRGRIKAFVDFTDGRFRVRRNSMDDYGHGTHVAGLIGGLEWARNATYQGVAPGVEFVVLKVLDGNGRGRTSDVIRAIEFAVANASDARLGIDIINLSLGHPVFAPAAADPLVQAVEAASRAGVIVVASAGNFGSNPETREIGYAGTTSPGNAPSVITAGAFDHKGTVTRSDDRVTAYSSRGPTWFDGLAKPDVVAPGHFLLSEAANGSALFTGYPSLRRKGTSGKHFIALSGTSMAAGVTTGVVALLHEAAAAAGYRLRPNLAKALLQFTAIPLKDDEGNPYDGLTQGTGGLNAAGALALARSIDPRVTTPTEVWTSHPPCIVASACTTAISDVLYDWAANVVWGDNIVWGDNVVWGDALDNIVWGDVSRAFDDFDNVVWGNSMLESPGVAGGGQR